jgi:hypothetical protein
MRIPLLLLLSAVALADYYPARFEEGYTFTAVATGLYREPDTASALMAEVPPGELLEIEGFSGVTMVADSCAWGWYEAGYRLGVTEIHGYVLDRDLAFASVLLAPDTVFVYRLTGFDTEAGFFTGEAAVVSDGRVLASVDYPPCWTPWGRTFDYDVLAFLEDPSGLDGVSALVCLSFGMHACGYENRDDLLAWTRDGRLVAGPQASWIAEGGLFHVWTEIVLPSDSGGVRNRVIHRSFRDEYVEETDEYVVTDEWTEIFSWTGDSFELADEDHSDYSSPLQQ